MLNTIYKESPTKERTRQKIIQGAIACFSEQGIEGASMYDVTQYVDITVRTLYRYYPSIEYLAVDAAYMLLAQKAFTHLVDRSLEESGIQLLERVLKRIHEVDLSEVMGIQAMTFIMHFDLYIMKLDPSHPAYQRYIRDYVPQMQKVGKEDLAWALERGIEDGSIGIKDSDKEFWLEYMLQSMLSIIMRATVKEEENAAINQQLVDHHIRVMVSAIRKENHNG